MTVWKLGCRWGRGNPPLFFDYLREKSFVIGVDQKKYSIGDRLLLTDGFTAIGVAVVLSDSKSVTDDVSLKAEFEQFKIDYEEWVGIYNAKIYELDDSDRFEYKAQQGIIKIQNAVKEKVMALVEKYTGETVMQEMIDILTNKKQIILQGAPGVGKTYATKEIALRILGQAIPTTRAELNKKYSEAVERGHIVFCTFHQSLDYEDFIEGYKPDTGINGMPSFVLRDGPFKKICRSCQGGADESSFEAAWIKFIDSFEEIPDREAQTVSKNKTFFYRLTENDTVQVSTSRDWTYTLPISKRQIRNYILDNREPYYPSYTKGIARLLQEKFGAPKSDSAIRLPHVLIIDEINRGNVSKIFGELITLLETDKRESEGGMAGETLSVTLTYSQEKMVVPHNLYIIGTMNTADRSLGQIDYALRRRFAFIELKSDKSAIEKYYDERPNSPKDKAISLFFKIQNFFGIDGMVNRDFEVDNIMIGHSYFMAESAQALSAKMRYEVIPLLEEYRRDGIFNCQSTDVEYCNLLAEIRSE